MPVRGLVLVRFGVARGLSEEAARPALLVLVAAHLHLDGLAVGRRQAEPGGVGQERALGLGLHAAALFVESNAFSIIILPGYMKPLVCIEMNGVTAFFEEDSVLKTYRRQFEVIADAALSLEDSQRFIEEVAEWYERGRTGEWPSAALTY